MRHNLYRILMVLLCIFTSCTDVIDVEVPTAEERLVIEASLDWEKGTPGNNQTIKLSTTTAYFNPDTSNSVIGAEVTVTRDLDGAVYVFEDQLNGTYTTDSFEAILDESYTLNIVYNNETYTATETLLPTTSITQITQSKDGGFLSEALELNVYFDDPVDETNFYILRYFEVGDFYPTLVSVSDEFLNGNEIHLFFEKDGDDEEEEFEPGDIVNVNLYNVSETYYNYMDILISQSGSSGNPFSPAPVELRGNCINITNPDNYPYGYFRVTQTDFETYTFIEDEE
ncbi:DUF4249 domain-containing protein [Formosa sediminum]|uniref:DUF4249 domain-containing protein n=1 Tax=Formosa sediminum TaxID=2594004 RepID=A0A516GNV2_9FLAO|nr:DUF4249 domain-containing protein [Formosa sediminum]QDO93207.1 DUF4249 domain-containing protein [Formosa sediminum]